MYYINQPTPKQISIACEIYTRQMIETDCGRLVPNLTKIIYLKVPYEIVYKDNGGADYKAIKNLLKQKGYGKAWVLKSVWTNTSNY